jgi:hypothetical protein
MAINRSHQFEICRAAYQEERDHGVPAVCISNLGGGFYIAETSDGKARIEGATGCCKWAMKFNCAQKWLDANGHNAHS